MDEFKVNLQMRLCSVSECWKEEEEGRQDARPEGSGMC